MNGGKKERKKIEIWINTNSNLFLYYKLTDILNLEIALSISD